MQQYSYQFKYFDPLTGRLPDPFEIEYVELIHRARKLLTNFSSNQLKLAIEELNYFIRHQDFKHPHFDWHSTETIRVIDQGQNLDIIPTDNTIQAIYSNIKNVSLSNFELLSQFSWSQIFAMMTIYYAELIATSVHTIENWVENSIFKKPTFEIVLKRAKEKLPEAYQALAYAEVLSDQEYLFEVLKTEKARQAILKRYSDKYSPLRKKVESIYLETYQSQSARSAASKIFEKLISEELILFDEATNRLSYESKVVLQTDDPTKQFEKWIGKFKQSRK